MVDWVTVVLVLGSNAITALSTFFVTKYRESRLDRRFSVELQVAQQRELKARNRELQERRREVRGEPLLKLRAELARMAAKRDRLLVSRDRMQSLARKQHIDMTEEEAKGELQEAENDWNAYQLSGDLAQILFLQCDRELVDKVEEIRRDSWLSIADAEGVRLRNKNKVIEAQELINKRLEEL